MLVETPSFSDTTESKLRPWQYLRLDITELNEGPPYLRKYVPQMSCRTYFSLLGTGPMFKCKGKYAWESSTMGSSGEGLMRRALLLRDSRVQENGLELIDKLIENKPKFLDIQNQMVEKGMAMAQANAA